MRFIKAARLAKAVLAKAVLATTVISTSATLAKADVKVVASIKPVHSLVATVMQGVGAPDLIVEGAASPHTYSLKPSQARQLQEADLVFWIGHELEAFLEKPIDGIATGATIISLLDSHGLTKVTFRDGGAFDDHGHDTKHDDHGHDAKHDDHGHDGFDPHVWLDPVNAKTIIHEIEEALSEADPDNAAAYAANASSALGRLDSLVTEIKAELQPVKGRGYIVFHDAYRYFETRFGMTAIGSITVSPEVLPGAERVAELQEKVRHLKATCVFAEPQFKPKLVATVTENTDAGTGVLDPLGTLIDDGPELYFTLIRNMTRSLKDCLTRTG